MRTKPEPRSVLSRAALEELLFGDDPEPYEKYLGKAVVSASALAAMLINAQCGSDHARAMLRGVQRLHIDIEPVTASQVEKIASYCTREPIGSDDHNELLTLALAHEKRAPVLVPCGAQHATRPGVEILFL